MLFENDKVLADEYPYMNQYTSRMKEMNRPLIGREHEKQLVMAAMMKPELCNVLLLAEAGCGKANPVDTIIPVADERGYIRLGDIKVGDKVFDEYGNPVVVDGVFPQGKLRAYKAMFSDGSSVECNDEHLWAVRNRASHFADDPYSVRSLRDMMDSGISRSSHTKGCSVKDVKCWYVPANGAVVRDEIELPLDPYLMGVFGSMEFMEEYIPVSGIYDDSTFENVLYRMNIMADRPHIFADFPEVCIQLQPKMRELIDISDIRIPEIYFKASVTQRLDLLKGFADMKGEVVTLGSTIAVKMFIGSENLANDVRNLAASLGYRSSITLIMSYDGETVVGYELYFMVSQRQAYEMFSSEEVLDRMDSYIIDSCFSFGKYYGDVALTEVVDLGVEKEMLCIHVDSISHLFQIGREHIVTHNTALVQGIMVEDKSKTYLEVDLPKMLTNLRDTNEMADRLKSLFAEVARFRNAKGRDIVLFIDEFHQIVQLSSAAVEVLKPMLADSGTRGIRFIAATTQIEYQQWISPNLPLVERLQRVRLTQPGADVVSQILDSMCQRYEVKPASPTLFEDIYTYTNRYIPANSQPRKSILVLDTMIGWHRFSGRPLDRKLLADVIYETEGINVAFRVDPTTIRQRLDEKVIAQQVATSFIEQRMQICVAGLNNPNRPMSSFLFTGSTGVGKMISDHEPIPVYTKDGSISVKLNGDLKVGDYVFDREGQPTKVLGIYPHKDQPVYEVELTDGRTLKVGADHLWVYKSRYGNGSIHWKIGDTKTLMEKNDKKYYNKGRTAHNIKFVIPMNQPVHWPARNYDIDPYVIGAMIGNGCLREPALEFSSDDEFVVNKIAELIDSPEYVKVKSSYSWLFRTPSDYKEGLKLKEGKIKVHKYYHTKNFFKHVPDLVGLYSHERFIPEEYKYGSVDQRWALIQGLFDTDGSICNTDGGRYNVAYHSASEQLVKDIQYVLYSLGVSSSISNHGRRKGRPESRHDEYDLHVNIGNPDKYKFFSLPRKLDIAYKAMDSDADKERVKKFGDVIGIRDIRLTGERVSMTCIEVDNNEHLYQAGDFIVTHNTETTKQLANILYEDDRNLIRFDMTEFALDNSLDRFRKELTSRVAAIPYCLILFDEIEKACGAVTRVLLQVLDDGRLLDENEREVTFKNAYIIITTNAGNEIYRTISAYESSDKADFKVLDKYDKLIREAIKSQSGSKFPPELLGRIDCIVPFQPLSKNTMMRVIQMKLENLARLVHAKHGVKLHVHKNIFIYLIYDKLDTDSDSGGARIVVSKLERELVVPLSRYINEHPMEKDIYVSIGGDMAIMNKRQLESEAYVHVGQKFVNEKLDFKSVLKEAQ